MARAIKPDPVTQADALRDLLARCEERVVSPAAGGGGRELFQWMDEIDAHWDEFDASGVDLRGERTRWESLQAQVLQRGPKLLQVWRQNGGLDQARAEVDPPESRWWWWLDERVADARRRSTRRALAITGSLVAIIGMGLLLFNRLFPVDPMVKQMQQFQFDAESALRTGDLVAARGYVEQALQVDPGDIEMNLLLGALAEQMGDVQAAEDAWQEVRLLLDDEANYLAQRGRAYLQVGEYEKALHYEQQAVEADPDLALAHFFLGTAYELLGDEAGAILAYGTAAELAQDEDPQIVVLARTRMAALMQRQGLPDAGGGP